MDYSMYDDIFQMAMHMYEHSDECAADLRSGLLSEYVAKTDKEKAERLNKLAVLSYPDDILVFKAMYIINPYMTLRINSYQSEDYPSLGRKMLESSPNCDPVLLQLVRYQLISSHMETTLYDKKDESLYHKIREYEQSAKEDIQLAYFRIAYTLSSMTTVIYNKVEYKNIFNLAYYLCNKKNNLSDLGTYLANSPLLKAYLEVVPQGQLSQEYLHLVQSNDKSASDLERFLTRRKKSSQL